MKNFIGLVSLFMICKIVVDFVYIWFLLIKIMEFNCILFGLWFIINECVKFDWRDKNLNMFLGFFFIINWI